MTNSSRHNMRLSAIRMRRITLQKISLKLNYTTYLFCMAKSFTHQKQADRTELPTKAAKTT